MALATTASAASSGESASFAADAPSRRKRVRVSSYSSSRSWSACESGGRPAARS